MGRWAKIWMAGLIGLGALPQSARAATVDELEAQVKAQARQIEALTRRVEELSSRASRQEQAATASGSQTNTLPERSESLASRGPTPGAGGIYDKPFLRNAGRNVYLGGYADVEFVDPQDGNARFDQHRLIPFLYADVSDRVKLATEIEFEHGAAADEGGEVSVEFATIDYLIADPINVRGGIVLSPLGKLNSVHDSPLQDLTERPLVDQFIIPTTLSEAGAGLYGSFYPTELAKVDYEIYLTNGFRGTTGASSTAVRIDRVEGLREARGTRSSDNNDEPAVVGRIAVSPFLGWELGASTHLGTYDVRGHNLLGIYALDTTFQHGPFELLAEAAYAAIQKDALAADIGVPDDFYGYYLQGNYHFMPGWLRSRFPTFFTDASTFTFVNRFDWINLDGNRSLRYTLGLNFRPTEATVFKADFQFNGESGLLDSIDNNALLLSAATYF